ncbi:hypothetical protein CRYUN_Cryun26dG0103300 [Craigia yunnanensis]
MASTKVQRIMTQPINLIFRFLQSKARIEIWLFEQKDLRIEGRIIGFDEYMNLVLDDAEEVNIKKKSRKSLGRILLKGDNITLMMNRSSHYDYCAIFETCLHLSCIISHLTEVDVRHFTRLSKRNKEGRKERLKGTVIHCRVSRESICELSVCALGSKCSYPFASLFGHYSLLITDSASTDIIS